MNNSKHLRGSWASRPPRARDAERVWIRPVWFSLFVVAAVLTTSACRPAQDSNSSSPTTDWVVSAVPPFATKEPQQYQAVRTTTFTESSANGAPPVNETRSSSVLIARDGEKRREEFDVRGGGRIVYVESPAGRSVLLPAGKLYADLNVAAGGPDVQTPDDLPGVSADLLVNEAPAAATYQRMGTEVVAGRQTTKYRVTSGMKAAGTDSTAETLIWIDEVLGMPVKSETVNNSSVRSSKATMELKDIRLEVDPALFVLPQDYKKVPVAVIFEMVRKGPGGQVPKR